jgi:hypothetical protein
MQVYEWQELFHDGRESVNEYPRCGRPLNSTNDENIERVRNVVQSVR